MICTSDVILCLLRQMRNRDSAMKSRERKKIYVKELEMKSKYLETECRRLDYALRCCAAENLVLRQCLQKEKPFDASAAKQESAVLFEGKIQTHLAASLSCFCFSLLPSLVDRFLWSSYLENYQQLLIISSIGRFFFFRLLHECWLHIFACA